MVTTFFNLSRSISTRLTRGAQAFGFVTLCPAGHGLFQGLALPAASEGRRNALGAGHVDLPGTGRYFPDAFDFESRRMFLTRDGQPTGVQFFVHGQWKERLLAVRSS